MAIHSALGAGPEYSVVIATKNRRDEVCRLLGDLCGQTARTEVLVMDDGSTDGTAAAVAKRFPEVRLFRSETSVGSVVQRNRGVRAARGAIVFQPDDDLVLPSRETLAQTFAEFEHPRIGAVQIPYVDVRPSGTTVYAAAPNGRILVAPRFDGCTAVLRRDVFLTLGGYRESLFHTGEESDYCMRMLAAGYLTRIGTADAARHLASANRDHGLAPYLGARNQFLLFWQYVPSPYVFARIAVCASKLIRHAWSAGTMRASLAGALSSISEVGRGAYPRAAIDRRTYLLLRRLEHDGPLALEELLPALPPMARLQ